MESHLANYLHCLDLEIKAGDLERVETKIGLGEVLERMKASHRMSENMRDESVENLIKFRHRLEEIAEKAKKAS